MRQLSGHTIRWWSETGRDLANAVIGTTDAMERYEAPRRNRARRNIETYEGRRLEGLYASAYYSMAELQTESYDFVRLNLARSLVNTALAKIAGKQRPKSQFVVTDADWSTKRRAKRIERFVEAVMLQRQGNLHDAWRLGELALRDAMVTDLGVLKFWADPIAKKVIIERILPWEIMVDPLDARYGEPQSLVHTYAYDREKLAERFPDAEEAIFAAPPLSDEPSANLLYGTGTEVARMIKVREAWRLPPGPETPGKHAIVIGGANAVPLVEEDWERPFFPFEFFVWEPHLFGFFGTSLVDISLNIHHEMNAAAQRWSEAERFASAPMIVARKNTFNQEELENNEAGTIVTFDGDSPPQIVAPNTQGPASMQWIQLLNQWGYSFPGISQMAATGQVEQGVTAAIAMRTHENIATERFSIAWQLYERVMAIGATRQIVACVRELAEEEPEFEVSWPGSKWLKKIKWSDVSLEDDQYTIQPQAVSGLVNTPEDRLQLASELYQQQIIGKDAYLRVIQYKDIDSEVQRASVQSELIEQYIEEWLDATPEKEKDGDFRFRPPIKWINSEEAILQVGRSYMQAELDGAPDFNLGLFVRFLGLLDKNVEQQQKFQAEIQAAAKGNSAAVNQISAPAPNGAPAAPAPGMMQ